MPVWPRGPGAGFGPGQRAGARDGGIHGEPQRERLAGGAAPRPLGGGELARPPRINRHAVRIARPVAVAVEFCDHGVELAAAFEAWIKQPLRFEFG